MILYGGNVSSLLMTCRNKSSAERTYVPALRLGGWAGPIRLLTPDDPAPALAPFSGLLLPGGLDIHSRHWQEELHPAAEPDEARDALELALVREAVRLGLPVLGICRGAQVLNVALGGSLIQDIPAQCQVDPGLHNLGGSDEAVEAHQVVIAAGSRLARLMGAELATVNSRHHQAVLRVAPGLRAVAWQGELVEAVEADDPERWVVGVQWHPENLVRLPGGTGDAARGIFQGFAEALAGR